MTSSSREQTDVLVVGAGPTGLLLAGDLAAAGVKATVLERRVDESNLTRAFAVHARTLEQLDARGIADELVRTGTRVSHFELFRRLSLDLTSLPSRFPYLLVTPQYETEALLERRALDLGAEIVRGTPVQDVRQDVDGVDVWVEGEPDSRRASYVVGTDGHHSAVRAALDLEFPGRAAVRSLMLADVRMSDPPADVLTVHGTSDGFVFVVPFGDGWFRVIARDHGQDLPDDAPVEFEEIRDITRRVLGTDHGMHAPRWLSRFHSDERQVRQYRTGRVFLAGDAAHVHSPAGGQGMNTGLQDAANLGWKLAAAVHGWGDDALLDSYHAERHPVGAQVLQTSGVLVRAAMTRSPVVRALRTALGPAALRVPAVRRRVEGRLTGVGTRYPADDGDHRLVGRRALDISLATGGRLYEALRSGRFVLVGPPLAEIGPWDDRVDVLAPADSAKPMMLVRPDGYVAWAGTTGGDGLETALRRWAGKSGPVPEPPSSAQRSRV